MLILIQDYTRTGLMRLCELKGIPATGTKEEMAMQLVEHEQQTSSSGSADMEQFHDVDAESIQDAGQASGVNEMDSSVRTLMHPYSFRDVEESIPTYGSDKTIDFCVWMDEFEAVARMAKWSDDQKFIMCRKKMTGSARNVLLTICNITSFSALKKALLVEFGKRARPSDVHRQLATCRRAKDETALDFIYRMQRIAKQIDLDEESICEYIIDGITDDETQRAALYEVRTISALKVKIELRERAIQKGATRKTFNASQNTVAKQKTMSTKVRCYNCGETGHRSSECVRKNSGPKCFKCGEFGHVSLKCTTKDDRATNQQNVLLVKNLPSIPVRIASEKYEAAVDTGSEVTLLRSDVHKLIPKICRSGAQRHKGFAVWVAK